MPSVVKSSSTLEIDYLIISITVQKLDSEGAGTNLTTCGQPTNTLRKGNDIVICEPTTNDLAGPRHFRTIHLKK